MAKKKTVYYKDLNELTDTQQLEELEQELLQYTDDEIRLGSQLWDRSHEIEKECKEELNAKYATGNSEKDWADKHREIIDRTLDEQATELQKDRAYLEKCMQAKNEWDFYSDFYKEINGARPTEMPVTENRTEYIKLEQNEKDPHYDDRLGKFKAEINTSGMTAKNGWEVDMHIQTFLSNHKKYAGMHPYTAKTPEERLNYFAQIMRGEWKYEKQMTGNDKIPSGTYEVRELARRTSGIKPSEELKARKQNLTKREQKWYEQYADGEQSLQKQVDKHRKNEKKKHTDKNFPDRFCVEIRELTDMPTLNSKKKQAKEKTVPSEFENITNKKPEKSELEAGA